MLYRCVDELRLVIYKSVTIGSYYSIYNRLMSQFFVATVLHLGYTPTNLLCIGIIYHPLGFIILVN